MRRSDRVRVVNKRGQVTIAVALRREKGTKKRGTKGLGKGIISLCG